MLIGDSGIVFDFPDHWEHFADSGRIVFHTPRREEIIVSARRLVSDEKGRSRAGLLDRMIEAGLESVRRTSASPELRVTRPLSEGSKDSALRCWSTTSETIDREVFFGQAFFSHSDGALLVTYEAPFVDGADRAFSDLLRLIRLS